MDLDVIRSVKRGVFVDDEDEFAEHRLRMEYPETLVHAMQAECDALFLAVKGQEAPFDGTDTAWFTKGRA
jgi:hypothetical protein